MNIVEAAEGITDAWFKNGLFFKHQDAMAKLFVLLGKNNLIAIDDIPHLLRKNEEVVALFHLFGMQSLLPETAVIESQGPRVFELKEFDSNPFLREYVNHAAFNSLGDSSLIGLPIFELTDDGLEERLSRVYLNANRFVNFVDQNDQRLLPMVYSTNFVFGKTDLFCVLAPFTLQQYHVFLNNGRLIDTNGYYDWCMQSNEVSYFQHLDLQRWQRIAYDNNLRSVHSETVNIELDMEHENESIRNFERTFIQQNQEDDAVLNERYMKREISAPGEINHLHNEDDELPF